MLARTVSSLTRRIGACDSSIVAAAQAVFGRDAHVPAIYHSADRVVSLGALSIRSFHASPRDLRASRLFLSAAGPGDTVAAAVPQAAQFSSTAFGASLPSIPRDAVRSGGRQATMPKSLSPDAGSAVEAFNSQLRHAAKTGKFDAADTVFNTMREQGVQPNAQTYSMLIGSRLRARNIIGAEHALLQMRQSATGVDVATYNRFLSFYMARGDLTRVLDTMQDIRAAGLEPDRASFEFLALALLSARQIDSAQAVIDRDLRGAGRLPSPQLMIAFVRQLVKVGLHEQVVTFVKSNKAFVNPPLYRRLCNIATCGLLKAGKADLGMGLIEHMHENGHKPDANAYNMVIQHACSNDDLPAALDLYKQMETARFTNASFGFNIILEAYLTYKGHQAALDFIATTKHVLPTTATMNVLLEWYSHRAHYTAMRTVLTRFDAMGVRADAVTFSILIKAAANMGDAQRIRLLLDSLLASKIKPTLPLYTSAIRGLCAAGETAAGSALFEDMKGHGLQPNVATYTVMIAGYCKQAQLAEATHLFSLMKRLRVLPNKVTYQVLLTSYLNSDMVDEADKLFVEMLSCNHRPDVSFIGHLVSALRRLGRHDRAREVELELSKAVVVSQAGQASVRRLMDAVRGTKRARRTHDPFSHSYA